MRYYAHSLPPPNTREDWEDLYDHLRLVAEGEPSRLPGARGFADAFGAAGWGALVGWWHDVGKYSSAFQTYLTTSTADGDTHRVEIGGRIDHSTAGAQHAMGLGPLGRMVAYCIAGHHAGLPANEAGTAGLSERLMKAIEPWDDAPENILNKPLPPPPRLNSTGDRQRMAFSVGFFIRMLFSCLVDADYLATESFMDPARAWQRPSRSVAPRDMLHSLNQHLAELSRSAAQTKVNELRERVLTACRQKAFERPGFFSLHVPTGGGKTLSSLAFALGHATEHNLRGVVYAIPFTSIIEQAADVFRRACGDLAHEVLEHHSNVDFGTVENETMRSRLAAENFDALLVVTTNVQLFESLFAHKPSGCRKLHRLSRSVIILDEAQTLPPNLLKPTLAALDELVRNYGSTVVLCTATQPAIEKRHGFPIGLEGVRPIVDAPHILHEELRRTKLDLVGELGCDELVDALRAETQVLCITNSRRHAADIFRLLRDPDALHLSANMCAEHRAAVIRLVRWRLGRGKPCRVISTQVIEAGVDVDFPTVYRATAGLDSIAQAAGRCNREGGLKDETGKAMLGRVVVFEQDGGEYRLPAFVKHAAGHFREIAPDHMDDILSPDAVEEYFKLHYWQRGGDDGSGWDSGSGDQSVMRCFGGEDGNPAHHQFREATDRYRLIEDGQSSILIPYGRRGRRLISRLAAMPEPPGREFDRSAQRYVVGVWEWDVRKLREACVLLERHNRYYLANDRAYDRKLGLTLDVAGLDAESLIV